MTAVLGCLAPVAKWELGLNLRRTRAHFASLNTYAVVTQCVPRASIDQELRQ